VIASFVQDKSALERGMFDTEVVPEELTQLKMGKIIRENSLTSAKMTRKRFASTPLPP
jgi:hypothetical protein